MAEQVNVIPAQLREAAREHRQRAEQLSAATASHPEIMASLQSLGPIFTELRDAGGELLEQRRACYEQQAAAHVDLADKLSHAADAWEQHDTTSADRLRAVAEEGP
jgi:CHASE3 domain sensor protein